MSRAFAVVQFRTVAIAVTFVLAPVAFPFVVLAGPVVLLREWLGIEFLPGVMWRQGTAVAERSSQHSSDQISERNPHHDAHRCL